MKERIISGIVMAALLVVVLWLGGIVFDIAVSVIAILAFVELLNVKKDIKVPNIMKVIAIFCMILLIGSNIRTHTLIFGLSYETLSLLFILLLAPTVFLKDKGYTIQNAFYLTSITMFLATVFNLFINLYNQSLLSFLYVILVACTTDIFALVGGRLVGKKKLTPISPKKTVEGSITGTVVATIIATTYYVTLIDSSNIFRVIIITIILSIIGQIGDLFFSLIKRENGVKDYSKLIPGHGGVLDRIDSIIFILITFVFLLQFI